MSTDTIVAIATPQGRGGIGIVRLSGMLVNQIAVVLLKQLPQPRTVYWGNFYDEQGAVLDRGIALYFPAPHSFTGESIIELHAHGSPVVLDLLMAVTLRLGARLARPGEFTERAFLNGKLDLTQAEAIADLIASSTVTQAKLAQRTLQGALSKQVNVLLKQLIELRVQLEVCLDFSDEDLDFINHTDIDNQLNQLMSAMQTLLDCAQQGELMRDGISVVIAGPPNAGKSSLLNTLSGQDTAIVTPIPGTTRDLLRTEIALDGMPVRLIDTAGLHSNSNDPIEQEGMRRARVEIEQADRVLWVIDATTDIDNSECNQNLQQFSSSIPVTIIHNKIDLMNQLPFVREQSGYTTIGLSAKTGIGIELLQQHLKHSVNYRDLADNAFLARRRHLEALRQTQVQLQSAAQAQQQNAPIEYVAEELRLAQVALGQITGVFRSDDLLNVIFADFCIGK
ncbi:tRNA uridine-5-carboxymethylaminomethyl(34) synthesis GTPase MnmE [Thiospirillum jenense]|uniref:tRNA modification GTPase MnmE n=1 Tax=Thiospirillum jenense TaxID=1653858 RepID=A0A839HJ66_9GAMM|nr:tRNA uridine-5-carboxymethylaminomethyl(34) synthesis GTPase MnmE [Thiospirillum jenense]MBB1127036.1 tRNA uridine-5-carboxymethylaminomethyl(34) synthesis GTPase MnmE [Thiospirillum jenense]